MESNSESIVNLDLEEEKLNLKLFKVENDIRDLVIREITEATKYDGEQKKKLENLSKE